MKKAFHFFSLNMFSIRITPILVELMKLQIIDGLHTKPLHIIEVADTD